MIYDTEVLGLLLGKEKGKQKRRSVPPSIKLQVRVFMSIEGIWAKWNDQTINERNELIERVSVVVLYIQLYLLSHTGTGFLSRNLNRFLLIVQIRTSNRPDSCFRRMAVFICTL